MITADMTKTIMTVDDSASMRQMISFTLKEANYNVLEASNGMDALGKITGQKIDLFFVDLNMPQLDGIGLIKKLRANPTYKFTPIVMLTTESQNQKKMEGKAAGATGWIVKPFKSDQLVAIAKKLVR